MNGISPGCTREVQLHRTFTDPAVCPIDPDMSTLSRCEVDALLHAQLLPRLRRADDADTWPIPTNIYHGKQVLGIEIIKIVIEIC